MPLALQHYIDNDLTLVYLHNHAMRWEDAFDASDCRKLQNHIVSGETSAMMKRIRFYRNMMTRRNRKNKSRSIRL